MYSFKPYGIRVLSGYGMTETANLVCGNLEQETHPDSVGRQYPCQEARIVNGELQVKGDMLFSGYWKDEATTRAAFDGDWLKSGDLPRDLTLRRYHRRRTVDRCFPHGGR